MKKSYSGYLYIILCTVIFSLVEVALKMVAGVFHPIQITALRFFIGGVVLLPFAFRSLRAHDAALSRRDVLFFARLGFLFVFVTMPIYQMSVVYAKASVAAVIFSCNPIFVTVFAYLLLREPIRRNHIAALILELLAVLIIIDPFHTEVNRLGALCAIVAALFFSIYSVLGKRRAARFGGIAVTCFCSLFGSVELMLFLLLGRTAPVAGALSALKLDLFCNVPLFVGIPVSALPWLLYIGAVSTGFGFVCHMLSMEKTSAQEASLIFFLKPMLAPVFAWLLLGEGITTNMLLGIGCFLVGSGLAVIPGLVEQRKRLRNSP